MFDKQEIKITLNGQPATVDSTWTLAQAITEWGYDEKGIAIALNANFIHRGTYNEHHLQAGDRLEILSPFAGG